MKRWAIALGAVVLLTVAAGIAWANIPDDNNVIHGCYQLKNDLSAPRGNLRIIDTAVEEQCDPAKELPISWNAQGPKGDPGPQGDPGAKGDKGDPGDALASLNTLAGIPCTMNGLTGEVGLNFGSDGVVTLRCVFQQPILVALSAGLLYELTPSGMEWVLVGEVTIDRPAPLAGTLVSVTGSGQLITVEIPAGQTSRGFNIYTGIYEADRCVPTEVRASLGEVTLTYAAGC